MENVNIEKIDRNKVWKFVVSDERLINQNGSIKKKCYDFAEKIIRLKIEDQDLIRHQDLVALIIPTERITIIYSKQYWNSRCYVGLTTLREVNL